MAITSSSTLTQVLAQYNDNLSWEGDPAKAALALEAIRWLLVNRPVNMSIAGRSINYSELENQRKRLEEYLTVRASTVNRASFTRGRMLT